MAGDWIKMGTGLRTHPKVVRMASALKADGCPDRFRVIGGLHAVWSLFDAHSEDGVLVGYTPEILDEEIGWPGFTSALIAIEWCVVDDESLVLPRFEAHNGQSAKRRAMDADRKRNVRKESASKADDRPQNVFPREEKRREEKKEQRARSLVQQAARFDEFWVAYPVKKGKSAALAKWKSRGLDAIADRILADVKARIASDRQWLDGYAPHASTYVNGRGWEDEIEAPKANGRGASANDIFAGAR